MSFNLNWYKPPTERKAIGSGSTDLKFILAERCCERDGSCGAEFELDSSDIGFITGLAAAGVEHAADLLKDLHKYGRLEMRIE